MNITYSFELTEDNKVGKLLAIPARAYEAQVDVEAVMHGEYRPATWDFPAEYPFLEVTKVSNLIVSFHEESQNLTFKMKLSPNSKMGTELDKLLEPHWDDIETHFWDIYHNGDKDEI